jgi:hypothetical protein
MASTLWVSSLFGDDRLSVGAVLVGAWVLPMLIRRMRRTSPAPRPQPRLHMAAAGAGNIEGTPTTTATRVTRKSTTGHNGRRRRTSRGMHH